MLDLGTAFTLSSFNDTRFGMATPTNDGCLITDDGYFSGTGTALTYQGSVTNFTAECWIEILADVNVMATNVTLFGKLQSGSDYTFGIGLDITSSYDVVNLIKTSDGSFITHVGKIQPWNRYHLAVTYDGSNMKSYINSNLFTTTAATGTLTWNNANSWLIGNTGSGHAHIIISNCRFSNTAKSGDTIKEIYLAGRPSW